MDDVDRTIINALQGDFPICADAFAVAAAPLGLTGPQLMERIQSMLDRGDLTRFGPLYNADRFGGHNTLAAMAVPDACFDLVADLVNSYPEVAHNYARTHALNMWFVVAADSHQRVLDVLDDIQRRSGIAVLNMPKQHEFHINLRLQA